MIENLWITFVVLLLIDVMLVAIRASILNSRLAILITLREENPAQAARTMELLENRACVPLCGLP